MEETAALTESWNLCCPGSRPIGHELRNTAPSRWVRFHSLPGAKRYPETAEERELVLARHNTVLAALVDLPDDHPDTGHVLVITCAGANAHNGTAKRTSSRPTPMRATGGATSAIPTTTTVGRTSG